MKKDLEELDIDANFEQIKTKTKEIFKRLVKECVNEKAFEYLKNLQQTHSKSKPLQYEKFCLQEYLNADSKMTTKEKSFTFAARTRMLDLKSNFKAGQKDLNCRLCDNHEESQQMLLRCPALSSDSEPAVTVPYSDLYSEEKEKVSEIAMVLKNKFEKYKNLQVRGQRNTSTQPGAASVDDNTSHVTGDMD